MCLALAENVDAAGAEKIVLSCEMDTGAKWELSLAPKESTLTNPIGPPVDIVEQNRSWIVAQTARSYAATSETHSGDFATTETWVINRNTGELWISYFLGTGSEDAATVKRIFEGVCIQLF